MSVEKKVSNRAKMKKELYRMKQRRKRSNRQRNTVYNSQIKYLPQHEYADNYKKPNILQEAHDHLPQDVMGLVNGYADLKYCNHCEDITGCVQGSRVYIDTSTECFERTGRMPYWYEPTHGGSIPHQKYLCCTFTFLNHRYNLYDRCDLIFNHTKTTFATYDEITQCDPICYRNIIVFDHIKFIDILKYQSKTIIQNYIYILNRQLAFLKMNSRNELYKGWGINDGVFEHEEPNEEPDDDPANGA